MTAPTSYDAAVANAPFTPLVVAGVSAAKLVLSQLKNSRSGGTGNTPPLAHASAA